MALIWRQWCGYRAKWAVPRGKPLDYTTAPLEIRCGFTN